MKNNTDVNEIEVNESELLQEERIMSFLRGEMTKEEEAAFMEELHNDSELKDKAIALARLAKGMKQVGEEKDRILKDALLSADETTVRNIVKQVTEVKTAAFQCKPPVTGQTNGTAKIIPFKNSYATILSIAASICLIVYLGFQFNEGRKESEYLISLGNQFAVPFQSISVTEEGGLLRGGVRGGDITEEEDDIEKEIEELVNNVYSNKDLDNTLKRLAELWEDSTSDTSSGYSDYAPQIGWALATGYLKDNNKKAAISILEEMANLYDKDTEMGKHVKELKELIEKL